MTRSRICFWSAVVTFSIIIAAAEGLTTPPWRVQVSARPMVVALASAPVPPPAVVQAQSTPAPTKPVRTPRVIKTATAKPKPAPVKPLFAFPAFR